MQQQCYAPGGCQLQHCSQLTQINHESGLRHPNRVLAGNASEDSICEADGRFSSRDKGTHMGQEDNESDLLCVATLAGQVGSCDHLDENTISCEEGEGQGWRGGEGGERHFFIFLGSQGSGTAAVDGLIQC